MRLTFNDRVGLIIALVISQEPVYKLLGPFLYPPSERSEIGEYTVFTSCLNVCVCVSLFALIIRCKYLENGLR